MRHYKIAPSQEEGGKSNSRLRACISTMIAVFLISLLLTFLLYSPINGSGKGVVSSIPETQQNCTWKNCPKWPEKKGSDFLSVHIISHTHDDVGWIKTVDDYYTGSKPRLVNIGVQWIYDTVVEALLKDQRRRFSFAETGFLTRWLEDRTPEQVGRLHRLITETGQIELIGGGWVQPDEAASHYVDLIDQYSLGLGILNRTYGECGHPKVAWQVDPFGHSKEHANLAALIGYEALFFARQHYLEREKRSKEKNLELVWSASDELKTSILTGGFFRGTYAQPEGFCFDTLCFDDPIIDNPKLDGYNVDVKVEEFVKIIKEQAASQRHNHVMMTMGGDFQYSNAHVWFTNLDKLIDRINAKSSTYNMTLAYSTPTCYVNAINESVPHLEQKQDDFFPYASSNHSYWTGYFTSRPTFKGLIRSSSAFLQLIRQLNVFSRPTTVDDRLQVMERASGVVQHHDAVTGTAKELVTQDYERRLLRSREAGEGILNSAFKLLAKRNTSKADPPLQLSCLLANESICHITKDGSNLTLTVFNGNARQMDQLIRLPIHSSNAALEDDDGEKVESKVYGSFLPPNQFAFNHTDSAPFELAFTARVPSLGFRTYFISLSNNSVGVSERKKESRRRSKSRSNSYSISSSYSSSASSSGSLEEAFGGGGVTPVTISSNLIQLKFDSSGYLSTYRDLSNNKSYELRQEFFYYRGMSNIPFNGSGTQASGAYIFRPNGTSASPFDANIALEVVKTPLFEEVRQQIMPFISQVIRLFPNKTYIELDYIVGPLPNKENVTIEVITRYTLKGLASNGKFETDSNGRQTMKRRRDHATSFDFEFTEPISANYFPINSRISTKDTDKALTILTDRSQGGTSLEDGQLEIMLHRRAFYDDWFGVEEALDEPGKDGRGLITRGKHWLLLSSPADTAPSAHRPLAFEMFHQPLLTMAPLTRSVDDYRENFITLFSPLSSELPAGVNLLTLKQIGEGKLLLRLEHIYQNNEDHSLSQPITVELGKLFAQFEIRSVREMKLAGNVGSNDIWPLAEWNSSKRRLSEPNPSVAIELKPMEIKTMIIQLAN